MKGRKDTMTPGKKRYYECKAAAREDAIEWQNAFPDSDHSYQELAEAADYFEDVGRKYGLLKEFRENGIL